MPFILILFALFAGAGYVAKKKQAAKAPPLPPSPSSRTGSNIVTRLGVLANRPDATPTSRAVSDLQQVGGPQVYTPQGVRPRKPTDVGTGSGGGTTGGGGASTGSGGSSGPGGGGGFHGGGTGGSHPFLN